MAQAPAAFDSHEGIISSVKTSNDAHEGVLEGVVDDAFDPTKQSLGYMSQNQLTVQMSTMKNDVVTGVGNKITGQEAATAKKIGGQ